MQTVLTTIVDQAGHDSDFIVRESKLSGSTFVQTLVFGWLADPHATLEALAQTAAAVGVTISAQGLDQRFSQTAAACLEQVLATAVTQVIGAEPVAVPILARFAAAQVRDSSKLSLPVALADVFFGCIVVHLVKCVRVRSASLSVMPLKRALPSSLANCSFPRTGLASRRLRCVMRSVCPTDLTLPTKLQIAVNLLQAIAGRGILLGRWVAADALYGSSVAFRDAVAALDKWHFPQVSSDQLIWRRAPALLKSTKMPHTYQLLLSLSSEALA